MSIVKFSGARHAAVGLSRVPLGFANNTARPVDLNGFNLVAPTHLHHIIPPKVWKGHTSKEHMRRNVPIPPSAVNEGFVGQIAQGKKLRGSGLDGPEDLRVFRLVLWNWMRRKGYQREAPCETHVLASEAYDQSVKSLVYVILFIGVPLKFYGENWAVSRMADRTPFTAPRRDGTPGINRSDHYFL